MRTATWRALASPKSIASKLILVTTCALLVVLWLAVQAFQLSKSRRLLLVPPEGLF